MPKDKMPNPIYDRLTRNTRGPSKGLVRWLSIGIGTATLATTLISFNYSVELFLLMLRLTGVIDIISPAVMAVYAASLVSKDLHEENFQMMGLTSFTEETMVKGYAGAAFHRMRLLAIVATALAPTLIIAGGLTMVALAHVRTPTGPSPSEIGNFLLASLPVVVMLTFGLWFFQKYGCNLGARLAVSWKRPIPAIIVSSLAMLIIPPVAITVTSWSISCLMLAIYMILSAVS